MSPIPHTAGTPLPGFERTVTGFIMRTRQWHSTNTVHSDPAMAARVGLKAPAATGQISAAWIQEMCIAAFGEAMFHGSVIDVRFRRPVHENDRLAIGGEIAEVLEQPAGRRLVVNAWARNAAGEDVTRARVEVTVPR